MDNACVKDLMIPLHECALVSKDKTLLDALVALEKANKNIGMGRHPHRAVLIVDGNKNVVGKIDQLSFLKALEPRYNVIGDMSMLNKANLSGEFIESMMENFQFFQGDLSGICKKAREINVFGVMRQVHENIPETASLREAMHKIVMLHTLSILVKRHDEVVGLLRLSDLFDEISMEIRDTGK